MLLHMARVFAVLSLVSIGGANSTLFEIRRQVVDINGWMSGATFNDIFAISHAAPGPNIIMVSLIGWHLSGLVGLLIATAAIMIPSCTLTFVVSRLLIRYADHPTVTVMKTGLVPVAIGLILASGLSMMRMANNGALTILVSIATAAAVIFTSRNPLWPLAAATGFYVVALQFGVMGSP